MSRWDDHRGAGNYSDDHQGDPYELPADLAAVQADDALIDMIAAGHVPSDTDDELTRVLAAWRQEVHAEPVRELVDTSTALALIRAAVRQPARRRHPWYGSAAAAAAVLVIAFSAVGLVAKSAQPGDHLWGATQMLYPEYAQSVETAAAVRTELNEANTALQQGDPVRARAALRQAQQRLPAIGEDQGRTELTTKHRQLEQKLNAPPDTGSIKLPDGSIITWPKRPGAGPDIRQPAAPNAPREPATGEPSPTPSPPRGLTGDPSMPKSDDQFFPNGHNPRHPYPHPYPGPSPKVGAQDNGSAGVGTPAGTDDRTNDIAGDAQDGTSGTGPGHRPRIENSRPASPSPDGESGVRPGPSTSPYPGHFGDPRYPGGGFPGCDRPPPRPGYCG